MPYQKYTLATGELGEGRTNLPFPFDADTEGLVEVDEYQDRLLKKVVAGVVVDKTAQEIADQSAAALDTEATSRFDENKLLRATVTYLIQRLNEVRTQPAQTFPALTATQVRTAVIGIYKTLT
ncbi:hypothetical protein [Nitrospira sp. Nam74]